MAALILFTAFCVGAIAFLISFFVALLGDSKQSRYVLKIHRQAYLHDVVAPESKSRGAVSLHEVVAPESKNRAAVSRAM